MGPTPQEAANVRRALKRLRAEPVAFAAVARGGHTPARRWIVSLADGRTAFAKVATDELTAAWIRDEHLVYSMLRGAPFMPRYLGFYDDGEHPVLALEDLSGASWPPPWDPRRLEGVLAALRAVAATPVPEGLPRAADDHLQLRDGWAEVARDPSGSSRTSTRPDRVFRRVPLVARRPAGDPDRPHRAPRSAPTGADGAPVGGEGARAARPRPECRCRCKSPLLRSLAPMVQRETPDVIEVLRGRGLRMTPQRRAIVAEIMRTHGHISPTALARKVQGEMPGVNPSTIYRTLSLLEEVGVLAHAHMEGGAEYHRAEEAGHVHLTCSSCGSEDDLSIDEAEALIRVIERHHGFHPDLTHFAISGLCAECREAPGTGGG